MTFWRRNSPIRRPRERVSPAASESHAIQDPVTEKLGRDLLALDGGLGLFRLVHLLDALAKAAPARSVLSVGSGGGFHETYVAHRNPTISVCGVDLRAPYADVELPNLRFLQGDLLDARFADSLPASDFVFSIECLEHIQDDQAVLARMVQLVRPGGWLYLEVPFASAAEQADPEVCRREFEAHEHVRPGYAAAQLEAMALHFGLTDVRIAGAFWFPIQPMVWLAREHFRAAAVAEHWRDFLAVAELDLRDDQPRHRDDATAIKLLARRPRDWRRGSARSNSTASAAR